MKRYKRYLYLLAVIVVVGTMFTIMSARHVQAGQAVLKLVSGKTATTKTIKPVTLTTTVADMNAVISSNAGSGVEVAASLIDLDTNKEYDVGETGVVFKAASTAKVLAAVDYLHEVEEGTATLTQTIDGVSAQQAIKQMIEVSDNDAWADINDFLGDQQQTYAQSIGLSSFTGGDYNTMTAADEAKLLQQLYNGTLINGEHRALLYSFMANTDSTDLIQAALPATATVYHKYGELWGNLHDAAIVSYGGHHFVLVIYTKNDDGTVDDYATRVSLIHAITSAVFKDITAS